MGSIWREEMSMPEFPALKSDIKTDVLIIGGGITGMLTAYFLRRRGVDCVIAEKDRICCGTTGNTTAKITFQHGLIYGKLLKAFGEEKTRAYLSANKAAFHELSSLCKDAGCDYEVKDNFVYSIGDREALENEMKALDRIGFKAEFREKLPLPFDAAGAVCFTGQAQFSPLKFLAGIAKELKIYEHTFVKEMKGCTAVTDRGRIYADKAVAATHFPFINKHGSYYLKLYQHRSYVIALRNAQDVKGMYVDESRTGLSFRNYKDILLLGGGGGRTGKSCGGWDELSRFAREKYPRSEEVCRWAAQDCVSLDGMPYIGRYSSCTSDLYAASGFNKWGMTGSALAAMILSDIITGRKNEYEELFSPSRSILRPQLAVNAFEAASNLLTFSGKRCPHLGCSLKWNPAEHSWDCACHGSRFTEDGRVIDNPANGNLR